MQEWPPIIFTRGYFVGPLTHRCACSSLRTDILLYIAKVLLFYVQIAGAGVQSVERKRNEIYISHVMGILLFPLVDNVLYIIYIDIVCILYMYVYIQYIYCTFFHILNLLYPLLELEDTRARSEVSMQLLRKNSVSDWLYSYSFPGDLGDRVLGYRYRHKTLHKRLTWESCIPNGRDISRVRPRVDCDSVALQLFVAIFCVAHRRKFRKSEEYLRARVRYRMISAESTTDREKYGSVAAYYAARTICIKLFLGRSEASCFRLINEAT